MDLDTHKQIKDIFTKWGKSEFITTTYYKNDKKIVKIYFYSHMTTYAEYDKNTDKLDGIYKRWDKITGEPLVNSIYKDGEQIKSFNVR